MDAQLLELICAFETAVAYALQQFLERAGLTHPFQWRQAGLPRNGVLPGRPRIHYAFHGIGLDLRIGREHIDFDFGFGGRTGGFDSWWLWQFAKERPEQFPQFQDKEHLEALLERAREAGAIGKPFREQQDRLEYRLVGCPAEAQ